MRDARQAAALALAGVLAGAPLVAYAQQVHPGETEGLGLTGPKTPYLLKEVAADPYRAPAEPACETIPAELVALNQVLGVDADQAKPKKSMIKQAEGAIGGAVRGFIPYRGEIRFLTQADKRDHQLMDAAQAGWARRGFLRGLEAHLRCAGDNGALDASNAEPLAAPTDRQIASLDLPAPGPAPAAVVIQPAPGQPWELPPPRRADAPAVVDGSDTLGAVLLRDEPQDARFDRPGR
jgi:hypothetical protein